MHEFSLMADLLNKIKTIAAEENATKIESVSIWMGALSHITPEHFEEHFIEGSSGSIVENAKLIIELSDDTEHPEAQQILLKSLDVSDK